MRPKRNNPVGHTAPESSGRNRLDTLLAGVTHACRSAIRSDRVHIAALTADSREVRAGSLFIALPGTKTDGHRFLEQAIRNGCAAVVVETGKGELPPGADRDICLIEVEDSRSAYATLAANYYGHPAREMSLVGITGTNGKTTITYLLEHILERMGIAVGVIGTVSYRYMTPTGKVEEAAPFTTPEPLLLQKLLRTMASAGVRIVLMEVSSHALSQGRLGDMQYDVAAFTNLSQDHLDYHAGMEPYFAAKTRLFSAHLKPAGTAVITYGAEGREAEWPSRMAAVCSAQGVRCLKVGSVSDADLRPTAVDGRRNGTTVTIAVPAGEIRISSPLVGGFNVENLLTTLGICLAMGLDLHLAAGQLADAPGAPGRLQRIPAPDEDRPQVFVDYAHTPDALRQVLTTLKALPHRNLFCVFGCGGDRDTGKRPLMGTIAGELSDVVIVTDDNPRSESPEQIIAAILPGLRASGHACRERGWLRERRSSERGFLVCSTREEAIAAAIEVASSEDIVLIAGKGHEKYQIGPGGRRFFDDCLEAQEALLRWNCRDIGTAIGGIFVGDPRRPVFRAVSTDSRSLGANDIFVALKGDTFDAHDFLSQAVAAGAGCLVVSRPAVVGQHAGIARFLVDDTQKALGDLARYRRRLLRFISKPQVIGITGSCGKTTVKEMTAAILARHWPDGDQVPAGRVIKTQGNFNNLIGLPLSLLPLGVKHRAAILEMGMNHPGEIALLTRIAEPDISCIVSIYAAHLEGLESIAGVAAAKEELFAETAATGTLVINLDDRYIREMAGRYRQKKITFSATEEGRAFKPDLWATEVRALRSGVVTYLLNAGNACVPVTLQVPGLHNVGNSLAAAAIAVAAGCTLETVARGLGDFRPGDKRLEMMESAAGYRLINDTYNANPGSMAAALRTLRQLASETSVAILGDMLELGASSGALHNEIGRVAAEEGITYLAVFGQFAGDVRDGALAAGMPPERVRLFSEKERIADWIGELGERGALHRGDWILVKASRGMRFETIVRQLTVSS